MRDRLMQQNLERIAADLLRNGNQINNPSEEDIENFIASGERSAIIVRGDGTWSFQPSPNTLKNALSELSDESRSRDESEQIN